jgi:hypothetical protein
VTSGATLDDLGHDGLGVVRTARRRWRCTCHAKVRQWQVVRHCEHGRSSRSVRDEQEAAEIADGWAGQPCHGGKPPAQERVEIVAVPNPNHRPDCLGHIEPGERYYEYLGETSPYQSGSRYCARCAVAVWADPT